MTEHPRHGEIWQIVQRLAQGGVMPGLQAEVYRYTSARYGTAAQMMSGEGSFKSGGRWNHPGAFHAVYCASDAELANREYLAAYKIAGLAMPLIGQAVEVDLAMVLDLRDPAILGQLGVTESDLREEDWKTATDQGEESLCQAVGLAAKEAGFEALLVPAVHARNSSEFNIVIIADNALPGAGKWRIADGGAQ